MHYVVPFSMDAYEGFAETHGFLKLLKDKFVLEYQTKDAVFGMVKTNIKRQEISFNEVLEIKYRSNLFRTIVQISTTSFQLIEAFGSGGSMEIKLRVKRKNRQVAQQFVDHAELFIAEFRVRQLQEPDDEDFPELQA